MVRGIRSYHPFILFLYYVLVIAGLMLYQHPIFLLVALILIIWFNFLLDKGQRLKKWCWAIVLMSLFILVLTPIFNRRGNHILFYLFDNPVMLEAIIQGVMIASTLAGILALFVTFNIVIPADKFLYLFSRVIPQWALLIMLSMRFVPVLQRKIKEMEMIQTVKGLSLKQGSIPRRAKNGMQLVQMLLTGSLEDSIQAADSMTARGYGLQKRSNYQAYEMKRRDWIAFGYFIVLSLMLLYGWRINAGTLQLLPELETIWKTEWKNIFMVMWIFLIGFPNLAEGKEVIKWKFYQRKISRLPTRMHKQAR
ncbi:energy-coupling factor transporter transmembrane component T [Lentibacillus sp. N15]|uniref:energy-coupling factor transporter transmembrane component T n=1 Tax=Lentibacillus songyuanensis TaxID=3136161 RepID=UPI0031BA8BDE